jgi:hypothetical protein
MAKLPDNVVDSPTVLAIYQAYKTAEKKRPSRRLGASILGKECPRAIWFDFRWVTFEDFDGRMLRLFETGHLAEDRFAANLRAVGCEVVLVDTETGQQIEFTAVGGHVVDKVDGMAVGIVEAPKAWHVLEFKTHSAKSFADLRANGLRKSKPQHYAQIVIGMHLSGVDRGFYMAVNKDTDELFAERVKDEAGEGAKLVAFAETIVTSNRPPERIGKDRDDFRCKWCSHIGACWGTAGPEAAVAANVNCRTCCHATPMIEGAGGVWRCERHGRSLSEAEQLRGCEDHLLIPDLVTFAEAVDGGEDASGAGYVEYKNFADGQVWRNSKTANEYRSLELKQLPAALVAAGMVDAIKNEFDARIVAEVS